MKKLFVAGIAVAALISAPALAGPPPSVFNWSGFYVGGDAGYFWSDTTVRVPTFGPTISAHPNPNGFSGGVHAGYRQQLPSNVVWGMEADIDWLESRGLGAYDNNFGGFAILNTQRSYSLRGILGYAYSNQLLYVTGGGAWLKYTGCESEGFDSSRCFGGIPVQHANAGGWTIGAGYAYAITANLIWRIEYLFADYGTKHLSSPGFGMDVTNYSVNTNTVRAGLSWKFGGDPWGKAPVTAKY